MNPVRTVKIIATTLIILSLALAFWHSPYWLLMTAFVSGGLIRARLTGSCPAAMMLARIASKNAH